jgi:hypothetical protein
MEPQTGADREGRWARCIIATAFLLREAALPARVLGDWMIYRTGLAGRLAGVRLPPVLVRCWQWLELAAGLLFLPGLCVAAYFLLRRLALPPAAATVLAGGATFLAGAAVRRFDRAWVCANEYDVGSAKRLAGRCVVFQVFVGPQWQPEEKRRAQRAVRAACDWLEQQATAHGISLRLITGPEAVCVLESVRRPAHSLTRPDRWHAYCEEEDRARRELEALRPAWEKELAQRVAQLEEPADNYCLVAHLPHRRTGFAMPARNDLEMERRLEVCACGRKSAARVYAHELLHLFGAPDLYFDPWRVLRPEEATDDWQKRFEHEIVTGGCEIFRLYFSDSIMGSASSNLARLTVDPITARAIGWRGADAAYMGALHDLEQAERGTWARGVERGLREP